MIEKINIMDIKTSEMSDDVQGCIERCKDFAYDIALYAYVNGFNDAIDKMEAKMKESPTEENEPSESRTAYENGKGFWDVVAWIVNMPFAERKEVFNYETFDAIFDSYSKTKLTEMYEVHNAL